MAGAAVTTSLLPCADMCLRGSPERRLVGLEMASIIVTIAMVLFTVGFGRVALHRSSARAGDHVVWRRAGVRALSGEASVTVALRDRGKFCWSGLCSSCWLGVLGMWRMREPMQALHYLALPAVCGLSSALTVAVFVADGHSSKLVEDAADCCCSAGDQLGRGACDGASFSHARAGPLGAAGRRSDRVHARFS